MVARGVNAAIVEEARRGESTLLGSFDDAREKRRHA